MILDDNFHADYWGGTGYLEYQEPLGRRTSAYARAQTGYRTFDDSPRSDNLDYTLLLGLRSLRFRNTEIDIAGGYGRIQFSSLGDQPRILGRASLRHRLPSGWSWRHRREPPEQRRPARQPALETTGSLGVEKRFEDGRTAAGVNLFITRFDTKSWTDGANLFGGAELLVRRQLSRRTQVRVSYRHWGNRGGYELDDMQPEPAAGRPRPALLATRDSPARAGVFHSGAGSLVRPSSWPVASGLLASNVLAGAGVHYVLCAEDEVVPLRRRTRPASGAVEAAWEGCMKPLIVAIVQSLVDKPDEIQIKEVIGEHAHVLELRVAKEDLGKVIGKGGAHASAIRTHHGRHQRQREEALHPRDHRALARRRVTGARLGCPGASGSGIPGGTARQEAP